MDNENQYLDALLHDDEDASDPYQAIVRFFDYCSVSAHRHYIITWLESVNKDDYWRESSPSDLLFYYEKLVKLIRAVYLIYQEDKKGATAVDMLSAKGYDVEANLLHPALYVGWSVDYTLWHYFPRMLNREEYVDPYLVFPEFFALHGPDEWCDELYELLSDGLSRDNASLLYGADYDMLLIQKNLLKLVEAVHLIDVREVDHIGSRQKKHLYTLDQPLTGMSLAGLFSMVPPAETGHTLPPGEGLHSEERADGSDNGTSTEDNGMHDDAPDSGLQEPAGAGSRGEPPALSPDIGKDDHEGGAESSEREGIGDIPVQGFDSQAKNIHVTIGGNYIVNHPGSGGREG